MKNRCTLKRPTFWVARVDDGLTIPLGLCWARLATQCEFDRSKNHSDTLPMTPAQLDDLAHSIAGEAKLAPASPGRSAAAIVRHRLSALPETEQAAVLRRALEYLRPAIRDKDPDWLTLTEAAARLRTTERALKRAFRTVVGRRAYGWPCWRANRWWVARQAVDPALAPAYFATLPEAEPWPVDALPIWADGS